MVSWIGLSWAIVILRVLGLVFIRELAVERCRVGLGDLDLFC